MAVATVDEYMADVKEPLTGVARELRPVIGGALQRAKETMWHGQPVWMIGKTPVAMLKAYPHYITFALFKGQAVTDPSGRLEAGSQQMASVKLKTREDIDEALFSDWLGQPEALEA